MGALDNARAVEGAALTRPQKGLIRPYKALKEPIRPLRVS